MAADGRPAVLSLDQGGYSGKYPMVAPVATVGEATTA